jgi:hypothetical protein
MTKQTIGLAVVNKPRQEFVAGHSSGRGQQGFGPNSFPDLLGDFCC